MNVSNLNNLEKIGKSACIGFYLLRLIRKRETSFSLTSQSLCFVRFGYVHIWLLILGNGGLRRKELLQFGVHGR